MSKHTYLHGIHDVSKYELQNFYFEKDGILEKMSAHELSDVEWSQLVSNTIINLTKDEVFFNEKKISSWQAMHDDATALHQMILPFKNILRRYDIDIAGGAVRDALLMDEPFVKDHDFIINTQMLAADLHALDGEVLKYHFSTQQLNKYGIDVKQDNFYEKDYLDLYFKCFLMIFEKNNVLDSFYYHGTKFTDIQSYLNFKKNVIPREHDENGIESYINLPDKKFIVKLKSEKFKKPIDFIFYDNNRISFIKNFDLSACQTFIPMIKDNQILNFENMNQRTFLSSFFILGAMYQKNILLMENMMKEHHLVEEHLITSIKRMQKINKKIQFNPLFISYDDEVKNLIFAKTLLQSLQDFEDISKQMNYNDAPINKKIKL